MTPQQVGLLFVQLAASLGVMGFIGVKVLQNYEERRRYRLFAVRDNLLYLVASGVLPETSMVFKVFYRAVNTYIAELDSVTIVSYLRASIAVKTELERENQQKLAERVRDSDQRAQETVDEFFHAVMDSLRYNSPMLMLVLWTAHHCARFFAVIRKARKFATPVYETYRYYEHVHGKLGLA